MSTNAKHVQQPLERDSPASWCGKISDTLGIVETGRKGREVRSSVHGPGSVMALKQCASPATPASRLVTVLCKSHSLDN